MRESAGEPWLGKYRIYETETFQEDVAKIERSGLRRLTEKLERHVYPRLRDEPHAGPGIKRLQDWKPPTWRYRVGAWRFFYEINETERIVSMTAGEHRSQAYD